MWTRIPYGRNAWLVRFADRLGDEAFAKGRAVAHALERNSGGVEWVVSFTSVLLEGSARQVDAVLARIEGATDAPPAGKLHEIEVSYGAEDLQDVARASGLTRDEVVRAHTGREYRVYVLGFTPGFGYLGDLDPRIRVPRRAEPRTRVPPGSVGIAAEQTGVYPFAGPGGWNLVGRTAAPIFDPHAADPFLLHAGDRVRFVEGSLHGRLGDRAGGKAPAPPRAAVEITREAIASVRDAERAPALRRQGVPPGGAMNPASADRANAVAGNEPGAPLFEVPFGGLEITALARVTIGCADRSSAERRVLAEGERFRVPRPKGLWSYLAVGGGGLDVPPVCGRASHGPRNVWGPSLTAGSRFAVRGPARKDLSVELEHASPTGDAPLRIWRGPDWDAFDERSREKLLSWSWKVTASIDRSGYRLDGAPLAVPPAMAPSEPVRVGTIQVPPYGQPIVTMPDGPTIGGYAKIGWMEPADLVRLAETAPGGTVRFALAEEDGA